MGSQSRVHSRAGKRSGEWILGWEDVKITPPLLDVFTIQPLDGELERLIS